MNKVRELGLRRSSFVAFAASKQANLKSANSERRQQRKCLLLRELLAESRKKRSFRGFLLSAFALLELRRQIVKVGFAACFGRVFSRATCDLRVSVAHVFARCKFGNFKPHFGAEKPMRSTFGICQFGFVFVWLCFGLLKLERHKKALLCPVRAIVVRRKAQLRAEKI